MSQSKLFRVPTLLGILAIVAGACAQPTQPSLPVPTSPATPSASVTGTVIYLEKMALPPNAVVNIKLFSLSPEDAPQTTIGEQQITTAGKQFPIPFEIKYDPVSVDRKLRYGLRATITVERQPIFTTVSRYVVITLGNPRSAELALRNVAELAKEYQELRKQKGHWYGGAFNPDLDSPSGKLRAIMGALGETVGQPPLQRHQIVALMGEPDSIRTTDGAEHLIYLWRSWHDYLYFVSRDGDVVTFAWWYAWE